MTRTEIDDLLQWTGAAAIIAGHVLNAVGPSIDAVGVGVRCQEVNVLTRTARQCDIELNVAI